MIKPAPEMEKGTNAQKKHVLAGLSPGQAFLSFQHCRTLAGIAEIVNILTPLVNVEI